jgi:hypothetical protein
MAQRWLRWSSVEVAQWLNSLGGVAAQNKDAFVDNDVNGNNLVLADDQMLMELGIDKKFHRTKILEYIHRLREGKGSMPLSQQRDHPQQNCSRWLFREQYENMTCDVYSKPFGMYHPVTTKIGRIDVRKHHALYGGQPLEALGVKNDESQKTWLLVETDESVTGVPTAQGYIEASNLIEISNLIEPKKAIGKGGSERSSLLSTAGQALMSPRFTSTNIRAHDDNRKREGGNGAKVDIDTKLIEQMVEARVNDR